MSRAERMATIRELVADALALEPSEIKDDSRLIADLGADSLDFIDLIFGLEKAFAIKIRDGELDFLARLDITSPEVLAGEHLTPEAVERLLPWLPALSEVEDPTKVTPGALFSMITLETLAVMVEKKTG